MASGMSGNWIVKSKLPPWSGCGLEAVEPRPWKGAIKFVFFKFPDIQVSWRHQMPKHETGNIFYWITWEVNTVW